MKYILKVLPVGPIAANCYIFGCAETKEAVIIDPGADDKDIKQQVAELGLSPKCVINTHGHADHIGANSKMGLPVFIHASDAQCLTNPMKNVSGMIGIPVCSPPASRLLEDGDTIEVGNLVLEVLHTPGHSQGSICLWCEDAVFTGDTLFAEGVGRTDLPGGSEAALMRSIKEKLFTLPDATKVYPGHGPATTIGYEKGHNPFFSG
ncbi:MAG: MBL fold metallo-hydrolase [Candidatus Omnitrophota bacterium]|jgi:glyoxylase-like metal-dependent hydrolase (beta-lactamase superfamily II)